MSSRTWVAQVEQLLALLLLILDNLPVMVGQHLAFFVGAVWLIIANVDRKMASSDTIIVSSPKG